MSVMQDNMHAVLTNGLSRLEDLAAPLVGHITRHAGMTEQQAKLALGLVGAGASGLVLWKLFGGEKYNLPPGPRPLPLLGNMRALRSDKRMYLVLDRLAKEYGPIYTLYMGPSPTIVISSAALLREAFLRDGLTYAERPSTNTGNILTDGGKDILMAPHYDTRLQMQRKLAFTALRNYASGEALEDHVRHAFGEFCKEVDKAENGFEAMEMGYLIAYNMLASMCFGTKFTLDDPFLQKMMKWQNDIENQNPGPLIFLVVLIKFLRHFPFRIFKFIKEFKDMWLGYLGKNIEDHMAKYNPDNLSDFTDFIIHEMKQAEQDPNERNKLKTLDEDNFKFILFDLFLAGTETTRQTLAWTWYFLAAYPEVQKKAQEEIDNVLGRDGQVTTKSRDQLHYVDAVLHEVMRIRPVAPLTIKKTSAATKLGGYDIPKGILVMSNVYSMHFDEKEWANPHAFLPERWIDQNTGEYIFQENGFIAFSIGRRSCIGESFAKLELHMLITMILQRYTLKPRPGFQMDIEPRETIAIRPSNQVVMAERR